MPAWLGMLYYIVELLFWILMLVFVGYGVAQFKRWVNFQMGVGHSGQLRKQSSEKISVDEFVE